MPATLQDQTVFTYTHGYRAFVAALGHGERCEIDEAMFIHWLEASAPICMGRDVVLVDRQEVRADYVARSFDGDGAMQAFWHRCDTANPADRRYFAQRAVCLV
jgi:hypothetical protein